MTYIVASESSQATPDSPKTGAGALLTGQSNPPAQGPASQPAPFLYGARESHSSHCESIANFS